MTADVWGCLEALCPFPPSLSSHDPTFLQPAALGGESQPFIPPVEVFLTLHLPFHDPWCTWQGWVGLGDFKNLFQPEEFNDCVAGGNGNTSRHSMRWWAGRAGEPKPWVTDVFLGL